MPWSHGRLFITLAEDGQGFVNTCMPADDDCVPMIMAIPTVH